MSVMPGPCRNRLGASGGLLVVIAMRGLRTVPSSPQRPIQRLRCHHAQDGSYKCDRVVSHCHGLTDSRRSRTAKNAQAKSPGLLSDGQAEIVSVRPITSVQGEIGGTIPFACHGGGKRTREAFAGSPSTGKPRSFLSSRPLRDVEGETWTPRSLVMASLPLTKIAKVHLQYRIFKLPATLAC